jgi:arylsulfatase A-like enzyme
MPRTSLPTAPILAGILLAACAPAGPAPAVVLVTCDTLRADHLGCYGFGRPTSPALDALAGEARLYEAAWSTTSLTGPALSALLTGRPPETLGLQDNRNVLAAEAETLAERCTAAGIDTAAIVSNWVLRRRPELPDAGVQQGFAHFDDTMESVEISRDLHERLAPATTDAALAWLAARDRDEPFFLWIHYQDPHGPYTPPDDCLAPFERPPTDEPELRLGRDQRGNGDLPAYQALGDERRPDAYRQRYEGEIRFFDRELGRLLDGLRSAGWLERVTLAFTADHGESLGERGYWFSHGQHLHREVVRVPLLLRAPGPPAPARIDAPVSHLDLFPTLLRALDLDPGPSIGRDLLAADVPADRVLPQFLRGGWAATTGRHRLIVRGGAARLFDLQADPEEANDVAALEQALVETLTRRHHELARGLTPIEPAHAELDAAAEAGLNALGYGGEED